MLLLGQVLRYLLQVKEMSSKTSLLSAHISTVVDQVLPFWKMTGVKTITNRSAEERLKKDFNTRINLCKSKNRTSDPGPGDKREIFKNSKEKLWDVGSPNAMQTILRNRLLSSDKKNEDILFYEDQRGERKAFVSGTDKVFQRAVQKRRNQPDRLETDTSSQFCNDDFELVSCSQTSTSSSSSTLTDYGEVETSCCSTSGFVSLTAPKILNNNEEMTKVVDRLKISDNAATMLASALSMPRKSR